MFRAIFVLCALVTGIEAAAREDVIGNGGDAIVCDNNGTVALSLDVYEARTIRGIHFDEDLTSPTDTEITAIDKALTRLAALDPLRAEQYKKWAADFWQEVRFVEDATLTDIPDSQHVAIPNGCTIQQAAIQIKPTFPDDPRYIISKQIWDQMALQHRVALIIHELVYREALSLNHKNSVATRYVNSLITSTKMKAGLAPADYVASMSSAGFGLAILIPGAHIIGSGKDIFLYASLNEGCANYGMDIVPTNVAYDNVTLLAPLFPGASVLFNQWFPAQDRITFKIKAFPGDEMIEIRSGGYIRDLGWSKQARRAFQLCWR